MDINKEMCAVCRQYKHHHTSSKVDLHKFVPIETLRPKGCKCEDLTSWSSVKIPQVCNSFRPNKDDSEFCDSCEHDISCHSTEIEMIGKKIHYRSQDWIIKDLSNGFYYLVSLNGQDMMERKKYIDEAYENARKIESLGDLIGQTFRDNGAFAMDSYQRCSFFIDGKMGSLFDRNKGCMIDTSTIVFGKNEYSKDFQFGSEGRSYKSYGEIGSNEHGIVTVKDSDMSIDMDRSMVKMSASDGRIFAEVPWIPIDELEKTMMSRFESMMDKLLSLEGKEFSVSKEGDDFFFWSGEVGELVYRLDMVSSEEDEFGKKKYTMIYGEITSLPTIRAKGKALSETIVNERWRFPREEKKMNGSEIRRIILDLCKESISATSYRRQNEQ